MKTKEEIEVVLRALDSMSELSGDSESWRDALEWVIANDCDL